MKLDDQNPLFMESSSVTQPAPRAPAPPIAPSLAPHELRLEEDEPFAPGSPERRARLQRYVKVTVAACSLLCLAALVRVGARAAGAEEDPAPAVAAAAQAPAPAVAPSPPPVAEAPPAAAATSSAPSPPEASASTGAAQDRELARSLLERGRVRDAIAAAERATAADPADADAWLILGSANQELGHTGAARAAFRSCLKSAKHGALRECRAMLR